MLIKIGFLLGGVILTIVPLLSLGADQSQKLFEIIRANNLPASVYHLDAFLGDTANQDLMSLLASTHDDPPDTIFLFSSPKEIVKSFEWSQFLSKLIEFRPDVPISLSIHENHQYAQMKIELKIEFALLKGPLFDVIRCHCPSTPIVHMTATATVSVIDKMESLTCLPFDRAHDLLWLSNSNTVSRPQVGLDVQNQELPIQMLKS